MLFKLNPGEFMHYNVFLDSFKQLKKNDFLTLGPDTDCISVNWTSSVLALTIDITSCFIARLPAKGRGTLSHLLWVRLKVGINK